MRQFKISTSRYTIHNSCTSIYFAELKERPLSVDEEIELFRKYKETQSPAVREQIIKANLRFVVSCAKDYVGHGIPFEDLINEGNLGLIKAVERYDETRGFKFISYAVWWIRQSISACMPENTYAVRLPMNIWHTRKRIKDIENAYYAEFGYYPSNEELSELSGVTTEIILGIRTAQYESFDKPINDDQGSKYDVIADESSLPPDQHLDNESVHKTLLKFVNRLSARERRVLIKQYGLDGNPPQELGTIGRELKITRERARQISFNAVKKLSTYKEYIKQQLNN